MGQISGIKHLIFSIVFSLLFLIFSWGTVHASEEVYYIHSDHLGSNSVITKNGVEVERTKYYPYGTERATSSQALGTSQISNIPSTGSGLSAQISEKGYTGKISDKSETGLLYYNARYYDTVVGKFTSADSVKDGLNGYAYVGNNPITSTDPTGHWRDYFGEPSGDTSSYDFEDPLSPLIQSKKDDLLITSPFNDNPFTGNSLSGNPILSKDTKKFIQKVNDYCSKNSISQACKDWAGLQRNMFEDLAIGTAASIAFPLIAGLSVAATPEATIQMAIYIINDLAIKIALDGNMTEPRKSKYPPLPPWPSNPNSEIPPIDWKSIFYQMSENQSNITSALSATDWSLDLILPKDFKNKWLETQHPSKLLPWYLVPFTIQIDFFIRNDF